MIELKQEDIKKGIQLTVDGEIFGIGGWIIFEKDQKVKVKEVLREPGKWSNFFNMWIPDKVTGVKIKGHYGIWFLNTFKETKHLKN